MKDSQIAPANSEPRIFLISTVLHCVSMTALVYLRSNFGFGYLRPKSLFIAFSWAFTFYAVYAWIDGEAWAERRAAIWFGIGSTALYFCHLLRSVRREWREDAEHDNFSGIPHLLYIGGQMGVPPSERRLRLWGEPATALCAALILFLIVGERHLSTWLLLTTLCLWTKEVLNRWFEKRRRKRDQGILGDAEDAFAGQAATTYPLPSQPKATARKARIDRQRVRGLSTSPENE